MAATYHLTPFRRAINWGFALAVRAGLAPKRVVLLTVRGRKSGKPHSTPVHLLEDAGQRWLVAPYGSVNWVKNARVAGVVTIQHGRHTETVPVTEVGPQEAAPILKRYATEVPVTRPYYDVPYNAPVADFVGEAAHHPVFRIGGLAGSPAVDG